MIDVNVRGAVQLTKLALKNMVARDAGRILFTSLIAATMPDPFEVRAAAPRSSCAGSARRCATN
jgi:NADP-dependent 3-hydroxy acid dehydrogenase YdfG